MLKPSAPTHVAVSDRARAAYRRSQGHECQKPQKRDHGAVEKRPPNSPKHRPAVGDCPHLDGCPTQALTLTATLMIASLFIHPRFSALVDEQLRQVSSSTFLFFFPQSLNVSCLSSCVSWHLFFSSRNAFITSAKVRPQPPLAYGPTLMKVPGNVDSRRSNR